MVSKRTALILIVIIAAASIAGIVLIGPLFVPPPTDYQGHIVISEVNYLPTGADEFLELYMWENTTTLNLYGWTITVPTGTFALQPVTGLSIFDFILIRFGTGTSDLDASDGVATIYLGTTITDALPNAGEATLTSATGQQIDYVRWGGGSSVRGARSWPASDPGPTANTSESIQLFGVDTDSSTNWLSAQPTPGYQNALQWYIPNLGYGFVLGNGVYNITTPDRPWFPLANDTEFQVTGHGVNAPMIQKIREMLNFTANFYETMGFPRPVNDTDGRIHVTVVNGTTPFTQATSDDWGRIKIFIGTNSSDIEIKVAVEHEMFHLVQWHREKNSAGDIVTNMPEPPSDNNWWEEGMAEYWGIRSTMANYEKTMEEVQQARRDVGSTNWWDHGRNLTTDIFDPCQWDQHWDDYQTAFQFIKFLMEKYGFESVLAIHLAAKYNRTVDTTVVSARDALEAVLGQSLNKILAQFYFWRVFNRQGGVLPPVIINEYISIASKPSDPHSVNITETAPRGGALVQHIVHNGTNPVTIDTKTAANSNWTVIVIIHHRDGTNTTVTYITDGTQPTIEVNPQVSNVTDVIKIRHLNANSNYINISINEQSDPITASVCCCPSTSSPGNPPAVANHSLAPPTPQDDLHTTSFSFTDPDILLQIITASSQTIKLDLPHFTKTQTVSHS